LALCGLTRFFPVSASMLITNSLLVM
jgi:hypothetical protein